MTLVDPLLSIPLLSGVPARPQYPSRKLLRPSASHPDDYILEIDNSTLEKFTICGRKSYNYSVLSREADRDESAQQFGKLFHSCEELRIRYGLSDAVKQKQLELVADHFLHHPCRPDDHRTADRMIQVLKVYNERYATDNLHNNVFKTEDGEPLVERPYKVRLCTIPVNAEVPYAKDTLVVARDGVDMPWGNFVKGLPVRNLHIFWTGRIDAIVHDSSLLWVMDHKTSSQGGPDYYKAFHLATQTIGYCWAAQKLIGLPIAGLILNAVIARPPAKTERAKTPREEFDRKAYFYRPDQLAEWEENTKATVTDFITSLVRGFFPMTGPKSFKSPCTYCEYHENCQLPASQRPMDLASSLYRDVTWSPINE